MHNLAHLFVKDVQVGIFVYGINSLQSFKNLDAWQEHLEKENQDYIVFLVGNKMDLEEQRAVSYAQGASKKRITDKCVYFTETSAYSNVESITNLFDEIGKAIVRKGCYQKNRGSIRLSKWMTKQSKMFQMKEESFWWLCCKLIKNKWIPARAKITTYEETYKCEHTKQPLKLSKKIKWSKNNTL